MKNLRIIHLYLGVFFAPLILFFAFTGIFQVFKLHETYRDIPNGQPNWIAWMSRIHKEAALVPPPPPRPVKPASASSAASAGNHEHEEHPHVAAELMQWLVAIMGVALIASTLLGLYIAYGMRVRRRGVVLSFVVGLVGPWILMYATGT